MTVNEFTFESFKNYVSKYVVGEDDIIKLIYVGINAARRSKTVPAFLLRGPPGAGKTMITQIVADYFNANYFFIQTTLNTTEDELIYKYVPSEQTRSGVRIQYGPLPDALIKSREKITVLTIDEFDKTRPSADALLLDYLQNARVSFRIDDREDVIVGNKDNLIVFITSNDNREFSEPLLRRVITINFKLPDPKDVEKLLRRHFDDEKIVKTLTTIYIAGLTTELTKPITIQELIQLGYAMTVMPDVDFNQLLLSFVVKNVEDLNNLNEAMRRLDVRQIQQQTQLPNVVETLVETVNNLTSQQPTTVQQTEQQQTTTVQQLLTKIKLPINKIFQTVSNVDKVKDEIESTFNAAIDMNTFNEYDAIIKTFKPEPTNKPDVLGKFKVVLDDTMRITSDKPLTIDELNRLYNKLDFEAYVEDYVYLRRGHKDFIKFLEDKYPELRFTYYTKDVIVAVDKNNDKTYFVLRLDNVKGMLYKAKIYVNKQDIDDVRKRKQSYFIDDVESYYQLQHVFKNIVNELYSNRYDIMDGKFKLTDNYNGLINFINDVKEIINPRIKITFRKDYKSTAQIKKSYTDGYNYMVYDYADVQDNCVKFRFDYMYITRNTTNQNVKEVEYDITNDVQGILNKYVGEYDINGIMVFVKMLEEIGDYVKNVFKKLDEVVKNAN